MDCRIIKIKELCEDMILHGSACALEQVYGKDVNGFEKSIGDAVDQISIYCNKLIEEEIEQHHKDVR